MGWHKTCDRCNRVLDYVTIYHPTPELADVEGYFCRDCALVLVPEFVKLCDRADGVCREGCHDHDSTF